VQVCPVTDAGGTRFGAPWSPRLKAFTAAFLVLMAVVFVVTPMPARLLPPAIVGLTALFSVRGYTVRPRELLVRRLGWSTRIPLAGLESARAEPNATLGSIRVFGIGGAFGFIGRFRSANLGSYRAYVTDPAYCVVLELGDETIVVTPDSPVRFVERAHLAAGLRA
jgi:hypothetical protein